MNAVCQVDSSDVTKIYRRRQYAKKTTQRNLRNRVRIVTMTRHSAYFFDGMVCCIRRNSFACSAPAIDCDCRNDCPITNHGTRSHRNLRGCSSSNGHRKTKCAGQPEATCCRRVFSWIRIHRARRACVRDRLRLKRLIRQRMIQLRGSTCVFVP